MKNKKIYNWNKKQNKITNILFQLNEIKQNHRYDFNESMEKAFDQTMEKADEQVEMSGKFATDIQNWLNKELASNGVMNSVSLMLSIFCNCIFFSMLSMEFYL
jgi:ketopantoate reductase